MMMIVMMTMMIMYISDQVGRDDDNDDESDNEDDDDDNNDDLIRSGVPLAQSALAQAPRVINTARSALDVINEPENRQGGIFSKKNAAKFNI